MRILTIFAISVLFFQFRGSSYAADISISNQNLESITDFTQELEADINLNINAPDQTKYYLRGMFFKTGTNNYCGLTWNGRDWFKGPITANEGWKNFPEVTVSSNSASLKLKTRFDPDDADCNAQGEYGFKIRRYTEGGSSAVDDQNEIKINLAISAPSATPKPSVTDKPPPEPTSKPNLTMTEIKTQSMVSVLPSKSANIVITAGPLAIMPEATVSSASYPGVIKNTQTEDESKATVAGIMKKNNSPLLYSGLILGILLIFTSSYLSFRKIVRS